MAEKVMTDKELDQGENAIIPLAIALGISEKELVNLLESGMQILQSSKTLTERPAFFIEEIKATFDAY